jgi:DNA-binding transcriptional regulator YiaG
MFRTHPALSPATKVNRVQNTFRYSDESLARRFDVPIDTVRNWRRGQEQPSGATMKRMNELLRLDDALDNARSGKYRQA